VITLSTALRVAHIFWPAFVEQDGCVFLAREVRGRVDLTKHRTRTAAESFQNHVHVTDVFRHAIPGAEDPEEGFWRYDESHPDFERAWQLGRRLVEMWAAKLRGEFPERAFRVYLTRRDAPIVRFHEVRAGEEPWMSEGEVAARASANDLVVVRTDIDQRAG
jgi:hypothetical protein